MFYNFKLLMSIYILNILLSTSVGRNLLVFARNLGLSAPFAVGLHLIQFQIDLSLLLFLVAVVVIARFREAGTS